ncbi:MAG: SulP family inorganic anion transporter [Thiobacillus sp.]|nr:SulP family inorganic anion transporter [Thiobacillus sp.]
MHDNKWLLRLFPFLAWFPINSIILRGDVMAGITGALVLVPKAMAYAQLSGLPVYFGLYTAFIPAILGALWGSSRQLATGPVAIISLMTAAALAPLAVPMSEDYIGLALLLTLMVGMIQFGLGVLKLGTIVNFVSHPVILGFMNAAAIIIALSQLDMLLGIPKGRSDSFLKDIWEMFAYLPQTHLPTLAMSVFSLALMLGLKKIKVLSKPSVLIAVVITTLVSFAFGFAHKSNGTPDTIADPAARELVASYADAQTRIGSLKAETTAQSVQLRALEKAHDARAVAELNYRMDLLNLEAAGLEKQNKERLGYIRKLNFERANAPEDQAATLYLEGQVPAGVEVDGNQWHIKKIEDGKMSLTGGGDVVGNIPAGLPSFRIPALSFDAFTQLFAAALIISLVAFMESISMAKALAAQTKQRLNPNQELIGQGIANMGGSFFQAYPATGSFTGSAINLQAGAQTGFAMVFNGVFVAVTLLFLTPYLYHLPKATLGVIILLAVAGLVTPKAIKHAWKANKADGIVAVVTFVVTLLVAPHLDKGIMVGAALALGLYLYRTMKPRVALLGRYADGTLRDVKVNPDLPTSKHVVAMRFDGQLYFANVSYFEDTILEAVAEHPEAKYVLVVGDGINNLDATGEEVIQHLNERLHEGGITLVFSGLKKQVLDVMRNTGLFDEIGQKHIFANEDQALAAIYEWLGDAGKDDLLCAVSKPQAENPSPLPRLQPDAAS